VSEITCKLLIGGSECFTMTTPRSIKLNQKKREIVNSLMKGLVGEDEKMSFRSISSISFICVMMLMIMVVMIVIVMIVIVMVTLVTINES
jgi:hypothetical protein